MDLHVAAIEQRVDSLANSRRLWMWVAAIAAGGFFEVYDLALTGPISAGLVADGIFRTGHAGLFGLADQATLVFATFSGLYLGVLIFAGLGDRLGRRFVFTASLIWYAAATAIMGFQNDAVSVCIWRFIAGIGIGAEAVAIDCYIVEILPRRFRGRGFAAARSLQYCAIPTAALLAALLVPDGLYGLAGWRWLTIVPVIGAVIFWFARRGIPESPRWLAARGRIAEANDVLDKLRSETSQTAVASATHQTSSHEPPATRSYLLRVTIVMLIYFNLQAISYYGFSSWLPTLLQARGVHVKESLFYTTGVALASPVAPLVLSLIADRFERKTLILAAGCCSIVFGLLFANSSAPAGWLTFGIGLALCNATLSTNSHNYLAEVYPTQVRARYVGFVFSFTRLAAAISGYIIAFVLAEAGPVAVFVVISILLGVAIAAVILGGPRTRLLPARGDPSSPGSDQAGSSGLGKEPT